MIVSALDSLYACRMLQLDLSQACGLFCGQKCNFFEIVEPAEARWAPLPIYPLSVLLHHQSLLSSVIAYVLPSNLSVPLSCFWLPASLHWDLRVCRPCSPARGICWRSHDLTSRIDVFAFRESMVDAANEARQPQVKVNTAVHV